MRKLVILALIFAISALTFAAECPAGEVQGETACVKCTSVPDEGIANCGTCTYSATTKKIKCTKCSANFYFSTSAKTACVQCDATCFGGECNDATTTEAPVKTDCKFCLPGYRLDGVACKACTGGCAACSGDAVADTDGKCTTCKDAFFKTDKNFCTGCGLGCKTCASTADCSVCVDAKQFVSRPDNGNCIAACAEGKGQGVLANGQIVCSDYVAPVVQAVTDQVVYSNSSNLLNISSLCAPASSDATAKKLEKVGAVVAASLDAIPDIDVNAVRKVIQTGAKALDTDFATKNTVFNAGRANWINIIGTDDGAAKLDQFVVPRGVSNLYFVCVNVNGVKSALKSVKITNNAVLNPSVRFSVTFNQPLNESALNNVTCSVAAAIFTDAASQALVKNQKGLACASKRILQAAAASYSDLWFDVPADQNNDAYAETIKGKAAAVKTAVAAFAKNYNLTVFADVAADFAPSLVTLVPPNVVVTQTVSTSANATVNFNVTLGSARIFWAVVATNGAINDEILRTGKGAVKNGVLNLDADKNENVIIALNATSDLWYYSSNKFDSTKFTANKKLAVNITAGSFSGLLSVGSFVLLVLALFI